MKRDNSICKKLGCGFGMRIFCRFINDCGCTEYDNFLIPENKTEKRKGKKVMPCPVCNCDTRAVYISNKRQKGMKHIALSKLENKRYCPECETLHDEKSE